MRVFISHNYGLSSAVVEAINYATAIDIPILNFSGGFTVLTGEIDPDITPPLDPDHPDYTPYNPLYDAVLESAIYDYPGLFICAAGNGDDNDPDHRGYNLDIEGTYVFPASYSNLSNRITVGAFVIENNVEAKHYKSNYGRYTVDLFAPGRVTKVCRRGGGYTDFNQTSCAAPFVAGVAALMLSLNPGFDAADLKHCILETVDTSSIYTNLCSTGGTINAYNALMYSLGYE